MYFLSLITSINNYQPKIDLYQIIQHVNEAKHLDMILNVKLRWEKHMKKKRENKKALLVPLPK